MGNASGHQGGMSGSEKNKKRTRGRKIFAP